jgi:hypothetical protein
MKSRRKKGKNLDSNKYKIHFLSLHKTAVEIEEKLKFKEGSIRKFIGKFSGSQKLLHYIMARKALAQ